MRRRPAVTGVQAATLSLIILLAALGTAVYAFIVVPPPLELTLGVAPASGPTPLTARFSATIRGGEPPYRHSWSFGDGTFSTELTPTKVYERPGNFIVRLRVTDFANVTATRTTALYIGSAFLSVIAIPPGGKAPLEVIFTSSISVGSTPYLYFWEFGDGATSLEPVPTHVYPKPGEYTVVLTIMDSDGLRFSGTAKIGVSKR